MTGMVAIGLLHFLRPDPFVRIVPDVLPHKRLLVYVSGGFEILGGLGLLISRTRRLAAWGLIALYVAVFPANVYQAIHEIQPVPDTPMPVWTMWLRLPFQAVFIALAWWVGQPSGGARSRSAVPAREQP